MLASWLRARSSNTHVGAHLAWVVLFTGALTFALVGVVSLLRLKADAAEQAAALAQLSRVQVARKLDAEARLADARLRVLFEGADRQTRNLSQRQDVVKTMASSNSVAIQQLLRPASVTGELDVILVTDGAGMITGASHATDLLAAQEASLRLELGEGIASVLSDNQRTDRKSYRKTLRLPQEAAEVIGIPARRMIAHVAIEPVFDDFGDIAGSLIGVRSLARSERTFELFSGIVNAGVVIADGDRVISSGGKPAHDFRATTDLADDELIAAADDSRVGRCVEHELGLLICAHVAASEVQEAQQEMLRISDRQASALFSWFLVLAAASLAVLVTVVLLSVRRVTHGLSQLASAAAAVARGDLDKPFNAVGIGEVRSLGQAFEVMLANLRASVGQTRRLAFFDPVTGLANRARMQIDGAEALASPNGNVAFLFIDLDRFKSINDTFGHKTGDALLAALAKRMIIFFEDRIQNGDIIGFRLGRLGGDEFLVILEGRPPLTALALLGDDLVRRLGENFMIGTSHMTVGASVGIALAGTDGTSYDALLLNADVAMYEAKRSGRNSCVFFTEEAARVMQERLALEHDLRLALKNGSLTVHYQPMVSLTDGKIVGAEALARWNHPVHGEILPSKFITIAEEAGLISELGRFVMRRAVAETAVLARETDLTIAVNVSVLELEDPTFTATVEACLTEFGFPLDCLEIEITESIAMRASEVVQRQIAHLKQRCIKFSLDDFGTGYSNLAMLGRLQVDTLKIDRSLVDGVHASSEQQTIVRTILALGRALDFRTVVEGVEVSEDLAFVVKAGADVAQGYYFSRAVPINYFIALHTPCSLPHFVLRGEQSTSQVLNFQNQTRSERKKAF